MLKKVKEVMSLMYVNIHKINVYLNRYLLSLGYPFSIFNKSLFGNSVRLEASSKCQLKCPVYLKNPPMSKGDVLMNVSGLKELSQMNV